MTNTPRRGGEGCERPDSRMAPLSPQGTPPRAPDAFHPMSTPRLHVLVPCAGVGARAGADGPKQYAPLAGRPIVAHTVEAFRALGDRLATLALVVAPDDARLVINTVRYESSPALTSAYMARPKEKDTCPAVIVVH